VHHRLTVVELEARLAVERSPGVQFLAADAREVVAAAVPEARVLNRKCALNFLLSEPTRLRFLDPNFSFTMPAPCSSSRR